MNHSLKVFMFKIYYHYYNNNNNNNKVYFRQDVHICIHKIQLKKKKVQYI